MDLGCAQREAAMPAAGDVIAHMERHLPRGEVWYRRDYRAQRYWTATGSTATPRRVYRQSRIELSEREWVS